MTGSLHLAAVLSSLLFLHIPFPAVADLVVTFSDVMRNDAVFTVNLSFDVMTSSPVHCGAQCLSREDCAAFTFAPGSGGHGQGQGQCLGYSGAVSSSGSDVTTRPGARPFTKDWLERSCASDADCPGNLGSVCFRNRCLCGVYLVYSVGSNACFSGCPSGGWQDTYMMYPDAGILGQNDIRLQGQNSLEHCHVVCSNDVRCKGLEAKQISPTSLTCLLNFAAATANTWETSYPEWQYYKRNCA